jgi:hypothetical protein
MSSNLIKFSLQVNMPSNPSGFREENLKKSSNQKQELPVAAMFVNESEQNEHSL